MNSQKLLVLLEQMRLVYGKQEINLHTQYSMHSITWDYVVYYVLVNKSKETLSLRFEDGYEIVTKDHIIIRTSPVNTIHKLSLGIVGQYEFTEPNIVYTDIPLKPLTEISKFVSAELECKDYINTNDKFDYLFCCDVNPEWKPYANIETRYSETGKTLNVYVTDKDGNSINTFLNSFYDEETQKIYTNSWSYANGLISRITKKVMGIPQKVIASRISDMENSLFVIKNIVKNCNPESDKSVEIILELNKCIESLRTIQRKSDEL